MKILHHPDSAALACFRAVFRTGSAEDPPGKAGVAALTAAMLSGGGARKRTLKQLLDDLFPMAASISGHTDKEMLTFTGQAPAEQLDRFYNLFRDQILDPGWREEDFERVRTDAVNALAVGLRSENDEELGKEALAGDIFHGHPFATTTLGTVSSLERLTLDDVRDFYRLALSRGRLSLGAGGAVPERFLDRMRRDFEALPVSVAPPLAVPDPPRIERNSALLIEKLGESVAISLGFPIEVRRGHPDYPALLLAASLLGQHRMSSGRLFLSMRQVRGLNYGDYAYIEHFPGGMFSLEPEPNVARTRQIFEIWIRPVERPHALFALKLALHELERFVRDGITEQEFQRGRKFLSKYVPLVVKTRSLELGYAIDSEFYGIGPYPEYVARHLAALTVAEVNAAIRKHLRADRLRIAMAGPDMAQLRADLLAGAPSPMTYNAPKPDAVLAEDRVVEKRVLALDDSDLRVVPVAEMFA